MRMEFIKLDEAFLQDRKIASLRRAEGYEGIGIYLSILSLFRRYKETGYQIPFSDIPMIAEESLFLDEDKLRKMLDTLCSIGLIRMNDRCFWSDRRRNDLLCQERVRKAQSEAAKNTNRMRWISK